MKDNTVEKAAKVGRVRRIIGDILIICILLFTLYISVVMIYKINTVVLSEKYLKVFLRELALCAIFAVVSLDIRFGIFSKFKTKAAIIAGWIIRVLLCVLAAIVVIFFLFSIIGGFVNTSGQAENVIVLGMALENGKPNQDLLYRVSTAREYSEKYPDSKLILTGGNPDESGRTEAAVMKDLLVSEGVAESRIILEDKAEDTIENFKNTAKLIDPDSEVILVSSNYHMNRAVKIASEAGFTDVKRLPAPSNPLFYGSNVFWEVMMNINSFFG